MRRRGGRVLLAEDNAINQEVAVALLEAAGLAVDVARNGLIAVDMVARGRYELVLLDIQIPVMDGLAATLAIRAPPGGGALPILAMTANAFEKSADGCRTAGMSDDIAKPVAPDAPYRALLRWLPPLSDAPTTPGPPRAPLSEMVS